MKIKLFNHVDEGIEFEIGNIEDIRSIDICVLSGDEVATVHYNNHDWEVFDSSDDRCVDRFDAHYELYVDGSNSLCDHSINRLNDTDFVNRKCSYGYYPYED